MPPQTRKVDLDVQRDVLCELAWDKHLSQMEVGVLVNEGIVTLVGTVDSWVKARAAEEAAHRVAGVLDVANDLAVKLPDDAYRTDTEIARAVRHALEWDVTVPDPRIQSTVAEGTVMLDGTVSLWGQRAAAEKAVMHLFGIRRVLNRIVVETAPTLNVD
ncbi:MAG TPA: BON domain-containing protein [Polyangia bacterium]|jgi:osmotically-inducible protein OsmY